MNDGQDNSGEDVRPAERIASESPGNTTVPPITGEPPHGAPQSSSFDLNHPTIVGLLYLSSYVTGGLGGLVGIILAYVWRDEATGWEQSHSTYLIRTFWIGLLGTVISLVLMLVLIGFLTIFAVSIWIIVRSVMSLVRAQKQQPMPEPYTWLI